MGKFPFIANGKAVGAGYTDGFVKVITNKARGEIVGVHAIGHGVTDLIAEMSVAMTTEATAHDILASVHPHPTLSEVVFEATAAALGEVGPHLSCRGGRAHVPTGWQDGDRHRWGSGIGQAICELFAKQGAKVAVVDISEGAGQETGQPHPGGGRAGAGVRRRRHQGRPSWPTPSTPSCATPGGWTSWSTTPASPTWAPSRPPSEADFDRVMAVNVKGAYLAAKTAVERMVPRGGGVIVNMASIASLIGVADRFVYSVSKGAILTMTYSIAIDYVKKGIRCNCIAPARIHTPFVDGFVKKNYPGKEDEMLRKLSDYQPIGRMGRPDEVASLALFLCSRRGQLHHRAVLPDRRRRRRS